ncbi:MAG: J domain-containing protein [Chloroflexi bacterium]|nr:J domain-containing protein [Chloroflexota bacterium]
MSPWAEPEVIQAAYRSLARKYHPDRNKAASSAEMQKINAAYEILSDPVKRRRYDRSRRSTSSPPFDDAYCEPSQRASRQDYRQQSRANQDSTWPAIRRRWSVMLVMVVVASLFFLAAAWGARFLQDQSVGSSPALSTSILDLRRPEISALGPEVTSPALQADNGTPLESLQNSLQTLATLRDKLPVKNWPMGALTERLMQDGRRLPFLNEQSPGPAFWANTSKPKIETGELGGLVSNRWIGPRLPVIIFLGIEATLFLAILTVWRRQFRKR